MSPVRAARRHPPPNPTLSLHPLPCSHKRPASLQAGCCIAARRCEQGLQRFRARRVRGSIRLSPRLLPSGNCCDPVASCCPGRRRALAGRRFGQARWLAGLPRLRAEAAALWRRQRVGWRGGCGEMSCKVLFGGFGAVTVAQRMQATPTDRLGLFSRPHSTNASHTCRRGAVSWLSHPTVSAAASLVFAAPPACGQRIASGAHSTMGLA